MGPSHGELLARYSTAALFEALDAHEPVVHRDNGNRAVSAEEFLRRIEPIAARVGVRTLVDISQPGALPVYQASRPNVLFHPDTGQSAHAEGRGRDHAQAKVACLMEAIERYCAEPRNPDLVRGTFAYLRSHRRVVPPRAVAAARDGLDDIPLMWTPACDLRLGVEVLAPAECIYFPFPTGAFSTPRLLASPGSNGLASGSTYLEAVVHGLYELIERMYTAQLQCGKARLEAMWEEEVDLGPATVPPSYELQLYAVHLDGGWRELPMVIALLVGDDDVYMGRGCAAELDIAIDRAISEVCQATVTTHRGARAHLAASPDGGAPDVSFQLPSHRSLRVVDYRASVVDRRFADLGSELRFLLDWLGEAGFPVVLAANLTRVGIEVPVVRTMVPGMPTVERAEIPTGEGWDDRSINALRYGYRHGV